MGHGKDVGESRASGADCRVEFHNKTLTKTFGSPYLGCYFLAVTIFSLGIIRDVL